MKTILKIYAACLIVLLAACTKQENNKSNSLIVKGSNLIALPSIPSNPASNPENPYDHFGYYHNIGLDSLRHYVKTSGDTTRNGKRVYLQHYFKSTFDATVQLSYKPIEKLACTDYRVIWFNQKISTGALAYWHALSDAVQSIKDLNHYDAYKQQVVAIESKISDDKLPADEKKNLLVASSILRYSGYYWINAFRNGEVVYHNNNNGGMDMPDGLFRKIAGVITGICADGSIVAAALISQDYELLGGAETWSEICGYYTGWW